MERGPLHFPADKRNEPHQWFLARVEIAMEDARVSRLGYLIRPERKSVVSMKEFVRKFTFCGKHVADPCAG